MRLGLQNLAFVSLLSILMLHSSASPLIAQESTFTYQGFLEEGSPPKPATGTFDFEFALFAGPDPFMYPQEGDDERLLGVEVTDGLFAVNLDFGAGLFDGRELWLRTCVREPPVEELTCLSPLHQVLPVPYSTFALEAATLQGRTADDFVPRVASCKICLGHADSNGSSPDDEVCFDLASNGRDDFNRLQLSGTVDENDRLWLWMECSE